MTDYERFTVELRDAEIARLEAALAVAKDETQDMRDERDEVLALARALTANRTAMRLGTHWRALARHHVKESGGDLVRAVERLRTDLSAELSEASPEDICRLFS